MNLDVKDIYKIVGKDAFSKGVNYPNQFVTYKYIYRNKEVNIHEFSVESQRQYEFYNVSIHEQNHKVVKVNCSCQQYGLVRTCKHIAACLIQYKNDIFPVNQDEKNLQISKGILEEFYVAPTKTFKLKKQLTLEVELEFIKTYYGDSVYLKFKIGEDRLYSLNNKLNRFLSLYEDKNEEIEFGKNFAYNPNKHFFANNDEAIINYLVGLRKKNPYYNFQQLCISLDQLSDFLEILNNKSFTIINYGLIKKIKKENPIDMFLSKQGNLYKLSLNNNVKFLDGSYKYATRDDILYHLPTKVSHFIKMMADKQIQELVFEESTIDLFKDSLLPIVKDKINIDASLEGKIILGIKPHIKIYLDLKGNLILCNLKLVYQENEINYFDDVKKIVRDEEIEKQVLTCLLNYGFQIQGKMIFMDDVEIIGTFLEENIIEMAKQYDVFTSDKMKETRIIKDTQVKSSFSIGTDNIMKYEFDLGDIRNEEIVNILETMKSKKKYYRLKSGDLLDVSQSKNLKELEYLVEDMGLSTKDLKKGSGIIPKYRAIYLDSVKKDKYSIIKTDNLFDELINNFNSFKNRDILLSEKDRAILRDYQEIGVKWLYNIYKCGFGGILADEMGLGKSIQLIYLIKQIIAEKKDAKILIVAPTSLIYNWKSEFDKFGSEINYKVLAENKNYRKQELSHINKVNVLITTYGLVRQDKEEYLNLSFDLMAIDEAQNIKNANAQMTKVVKELKAQTKLALTGTPLENSVLELWSIFDFIMPGYLATQVNFQKKYNIKDVDINNLRQLNNLNKQIKPFILRRKKQDVVKELPEKIENNIYIDLNPEQKKLYVAQLEKTKKEMDEIIQNEGFKKGSFRILQLLTKLRQLCIDPRIIYENYKGGSVKIENLLNLTEQIIKNGHKIILFTSYKTALDIVNREFNSHNISTYVIDGSVSAKKRIELVNKFNSDATNVFLITLKAGGTGLNLTSADVVIHLDLWWNPQVENQATDRAHRIGQKNTVEVIKLICKGTIEERILELQNKKKTLSDALIEGEDRDENIISKLTEKDIKKLLSLDNDDE